jgi:biotin operon repressor
MTDLLAGKKEILGYLRCSDWARVQRLIRDGLPIKKNGGRWEALRSAIDEWYKGRMQTVH